MINRRDTALKHILEIRRRDLQEHLGARLAEVRSDGREGLLRAADDADASESGLQQHISVSLTEMTAEVLRRVDDALARLAAGVYGLCVECQGEIPEKRLVALPFALRCRECEELREIHEQRSRRFSAEAGGALPRLDADLGG